MYNASSQRSFPDPHYAHDYLQFRIDEYSHLTRLLLEMASLHPPMLLDLPWILMCPFSSSSRLQAHATGRVLLQLGDVLPADNVPGSHVLLHALGEAGLLALGQRGAGLRHAALEAVLVQFLYLGNSMVVSQFSSCTSSCLSHWEFWTVSRKWRWRRRCVGMQMIRTSTSWRAFATAAS